ncbi:MAG: hypothetical protein LC118_03805 [Dehalococcoidia bacterium]|nr:hypothetical protein [Dehalococcoidia bacterium]
MPQAQDIVDVNRGAGQMMRFMGIDTVTPLISFARQADGVAGHVEFGHGVPGIAPIELDPSLRSDARKTWRVIAHELAHVYLRTHCIDIDTGNQDWDGRHREYLTETAAIFAGLGKVMLNAGPLRGTYLGLWDLAFIYSSVCTMRGISSADSETGIVDSQALGQLRQIRTDYRWLLSASPGSLPQHGDRAEVDRLVTRLRQQLISVRRILELVAADVDTGRRLAQGQGKASGAPDVYDPALRVLLAMMAEESASRLSVDLTRRLRSHVELLAALLVETSARGY